MKPFTLFTFPSGLTFQVPTQVIANNRAQNYAAEFGDDLQRSLAEDTVPLFTEDEYNVQDWALSNMNWSDLAPFARLVECSTTAPDEDQFMQALVTLSATATVPKIPNDGTLLLKPTELLIYDMANEGLTAKVLFIETGPAPSDYKIAFNMVQGPKQIVDGYIGVAQQFTNFLLERANEEAAAQDQAQGTNLPKH